MKVAVVGATGLVGSKMLEVLEEQQFPVSELLPVASSRSWGKKVRFQGKEWTVISAEEAVECRPQLALFSAGGSVSGEWAPKFAAVGCKFRLIKLYEFIIRDVARQAVIPWGEEIVAAHC